MVEYVRDPSPQPGRNTVVKLDPSGRELWQQSPCGYVTHIATDGACQTYVAGFRCDGAPGMVVQRISDAQAR